MTDSSNPYDAPMVKPGDQVAFERNGYIYTDTIESVTYSSSKYVPAPERTLWQRITRRLTPRRWRKPLPQPSRTSPTITVTVDYDPEPAARALARIEQMMAELGIAADE